MHLQLFFSACFRLSLILMLWAESPTHPACLSATWTKLIQGRGPLQEVFRSGSSDAGQTHCDPLPVQYMESSPAWCNVGYAVEYDPARDAWRRR